MRALFFEMSVVPSESRGPVAGMGESSDDVSISTPRHKSRLTLQMVQTIAIIHGNGTKRTGSG